ncbi:hypothetical protein D9757_013818 [Collybiopsis confluens]|uniref:E3 ubiquitin-protein ligase listerin n=1 Tax=Collybiopsis confluens TaxID=2823264 RepID=A0A8H5CUT7_9AGAR|nr:hypothetical protein D9757_013818 [Collybiopsis confluens]
MKDGTGWLPGYCTEGSEDCRIYFHLRGRSGSGEWRKEVCQALLKQKKNITTTTSSFSPSLPPFANFLLSIVHSAARSDSYRDCRIVREVLGRLFQSGIGGDVVIPEEEANLWIQYARSVSEPEKSAKAPLAGITILSTLVINLPSSSSSTLPRLDRYRNELASALLGVPPSRATSDGLRVLLKLVMGTAPDMEGEVGFLPVQRAVNVVKACQKWVEDGGETMMMIMMRRMRVSVPGSHWSFIFDVLENNIESPLRQNCEIKFNSSRPNSSSTSSSQLTTLARTLRLIGHIQDLASTNKSLRADWSEKRDDIMRGVQNLLMGGSGSEDSSSVGYWSIPEGVCRKLALELVAKYLPNKLMCHLLSALPSSSLTSTNVSPIIEHHKLAYQILQKVAAKYTEHFVFEAGLDTEGVFEAKLPEELMVVLQRTLDFDLEEGTENRGHEQSMKVRMRYIEQIRNLGLIERHFIPNIFGLLGIDRGIVKTFKLDIWSVNEFYVQFYEAGSQCGIQTFAAHLYYRALLVVPSLIYAWVLDCRDRQLSSTIATYTSSHFSPVLIRTELDHVKSPEAQSELSSEDNQLTVKVASGR